jgi:hypothetical protein
MKTFICIRCVQRGLSPAPRMLSFGLDVGDWSALVGGLTLPDLSFF